jgi:hypothetical protein
MKDLDPKSTASQQWLWFGVALLAMLVIAYVATIFPKV